MARTAPRPKQQLADKLGPFPRINPEVVVRADPQLIMIGERNAAGLEQRPGWAGMRALRERRVCVGAIHPAADESLAQPAADERR